ncbi:hypothetical protein VTJ04DRAFT_7083 [Mycothermus thermophilus]|uniref:uncharacterized protein n=1 Tax=Humicola insolens TaxID=85995 RepID=UPI0037424888
MLPESSALAPDNSQEHELTMSRVWTLEGARPWFGAGRLGRGTGQVNSHSSNVTLFSGGKVGRTTLAARYAATCSAPDQGSRARELSGNWASLEAIVYSLVVLPAKTVPFLLRFTQLGCPWVFVIVVPVLLSLCLEPRTIVPIHLHYLDDDIGTRGQVPRSVLHDITRQTGLHDTTSLTPTPVSHIFLLLGRPNDRLS